MNRKKILVVDDNRVILKTISMKLKANGYDALAAEDGSEALNIVRHEQPDLILMDISFPADVAHGGGVSWDGFLIMDWLRRGEQGRSIPFIVITGTDSPQIKQKALAAGAAAFFQKPVNNAELLSTLQQILEKTEPKTTGAMSGS